MPKQRSSQNSSPLPVFEKTNIQDVFIINRPYFSDDRGGFQEVVRLPDLEKILGYQIDIRQINRSFNKPKVLRGLHIAPWGKLVTCYFGEVYQVVVDCRKDSDDFKKVAAAYIGTSHPCSMWVPPGCANGFCVVGPQGAAYGYAVTQVFEPGKEIELRWNDPEFFEKISWPVSDPLISERDKIARSFRELF